MTVNHEVIVNPDEIILEEEKKQLLKNFFNILIKNKSHQLL